VLGRSFMVPKETPSSSSAGTMPSLLAEAFGVMVAAPLCLKSVWSLFEGLVLGCRGEAMEERARGEGEEVRAGVWVHGKCRNCLATAIGVLGDEEESKLKLFSVCVCV